EHDDPRLGSHAEAGDITDPDCHTEIQRWCRPAVQDLGEEELKERTASKGLRYGQHHQARVGQILVGQVEDNENQHDHRWKDKAERLGCSDLMLELAAPLNMDTFR